MAKKRELDMLVEFLLKQEFGGSMVSLATR